MFTINSLVLVEAEAANKSSLNGRLEKELESVRRQLQSESEVNMGLLNEKEALISRENNLTTEANKLRSDFEDCTNKYPSPLEFLRVGLDIIFHRLKQLETCYEVSNNSLNT